MYSIDNPEMETERIEMMRRVEEAKSDADWRAIGGFKTQDQKFAYEMTELMRDMLGFLDSWEEAVDRRISELNGTIDMRNEEIERLENTVHQIEEWVKDATRLQGVTDIIRRGQNDW